MSCVARGVLYVELAYESVTMYGPFARSRAATSRATPGVRSQSAPLSDSVASARERANSKAEAMLPHSKGVRCVTNMRVLLTKVAARQDLDETDADSLRNISDTFKRGYGWTEEDIQRDHEQEERELDAQIPAEQAHYRRGVEDGFRTMAQMNSRRLKRARLALKAAREG